MLIPIDSIQVNPQQPRSLIPPESLAELAESIRTHGLINAISVEQAEGETFILVDGERRWRAAKLAGLSEIEATVRPGLNGAGSVERLILATVANIQREDMNPMDKAHAFQSLLDTGMSQAEVSKVTGLSQATIHNFLLLLRLPKPVQLLYQSGAIPADVRAARAILDLADVDLQVAVAKAAASKRLAGGEIVTLARRMSNGKKAGRLSRARMKTKSELSPTWSGKWNMIAAAGNPTMIKAWKDSAIEVCKVCPLYEDASPKICKDCPGAELLKRLAKGDA